MDTSLLRVSAGSLACAALVTLSGAGGAAARAQSQEAAQAPVFRSGVDLVAIDVSVVDKSGAPVRSLTADRFTVTVDGRPRRVISAELVDHSPPPEPGKDPAADADLVPVYSSNDRQWATARSGRVFYLLVDQGSFQSSRTNAVVAATRRFVQGLQPGDRVGVVAFPGPGPVMGATADHAAVRLALSSLSGMNHSRRALGPSLSLAESADIGSGDSMALSSTVQRECRGLRGVQLSMCTSQVQEEARNVTMTAEMQTRFALGEIQRVIEALQLTPERKTLVLVSAGLPASDRGTGSLSMTPEITQAARDVAKANANLYVLHLDSAFLDAFSPSEQQLSRTVTRDASIISSGLETLAGASGGTLLRVTSDSDSAFDRVLRETASTYMLGLEPEDSDRDAKPHTVRINVNIPGAQVRFRRELLVSPVVRSAAVVSPVSLALSAPRVATALPVGVSTRTVTVEPTGGVRVLVSAQVGKDVPGAAEFTVGVIVRDAQGRVVLSSRPESARLVVPPGNARGSASYLLTLALQPGDYRLRLAAVDAEGRVGSVDHAFSAALAEGDGLMMSDLVLFHPVATASDLLALIPDGRLQTRAVAAHIEVFEPSGTPAPGVTFGVADRVDGQLLVKARATLSKGAMSGQSNADAVLDLALLPPGNYMAVAIVDRGGRSVGRRFQPLYLDRPAGAPGAGVPGAVATAGAAPRVRFAPGMTASLVKTFAKGDVLTQPALAYFGNRLKEADESPSPAAASALAELQNGRFDAVLASLGRAPSDGLSAAFLKGLALLAKGQLEPAAAEFRQALRISDDFLPAAFYLGACYAAGGKDDEAVGAWQTALATESDARIVYDVLADALLRLEEPDHTIQVLDEARGRWPEDEGFLPRRAVAEAMLGRRANALDTLQRYLDTHRTDTEAAALGIRLIYEAHAAGQTIGSQESDRAAAVRYGEWYRAGGGQNQALIDRWLGFIAKQ
jgi:VWFA-related protein